MRTKRLLRAAAAALLVAGVLVGGGVASAGDTAGTSITVTPPAGLHDSDVVSVAGTGYTPLGNDVSIVQCLTGSEPFACDHEAATVLVAVDASGAFPPTPFTVHTTFNRGTSESPILVNCLIAPGCFISAGQADPNIHATRSISFGTPSTLTGTVTLPPGVPPLGQLYDVVACPGNVAFGANCSGRLSTPITVSTSTSGTYGFASGVAPGSWNVGLRVFGNSTLRAPITPLQLSGAPSTADLTVTADVLSGTVSVPAGLPVQAFGVTACLAPGQPATTAPNTSPCAPNAFSANTAVNPSSGAYSLRLLPIQGGHWNAGVSMSAIRPIGQVAHNVDLAPSGTATHGFVLSTGDFATLTGRISDSTGATVPGSGLVACLGAQPVTVPCGGSLGLNTVANPDGTYTQLFPAGTFNVATASFGPAGPVTNGASAPFAFVAGTATTCNLKLGSPSCVADNTQPGVVVTSPVDGASYTLHQGVPASYVCSDASGIASCVGTTVDTSTSGVHAFSVTAIDNASNTRAVNQSYTVLDGGDAIQQITSGGSLTTDPTNLGATPDIPVHTAISLPSSVSGSFTVDSQPAGPAPSGFSFFGRQVVLTGPIAAEPYTVTFTIDASELDGVAPTDVQVFRDGNAVAGCTAPALANPDPCVQQRVLGAGGDAVVTVLTTHFSTWSLGRLSYDFAGFFSPVNNLPTLNSAKAGSAIPVKFSLGADRGLDVLVAGSPASQRIDCSSSAPVDSIEVTATAGSSSLSYDAGTGRYTYVWKTDKAWSAGSCRQLVLSFRDGTVVTAHFTFQ